MRHSSKNRKLGRVRKVRNGLMKSLAYSLVMKEKIKTTDAKARELRPDIEKMITMAKKNTVASRRLLVARVGSEAGEKLATKLSERFATRAGGYTRITKLPRRAGDASLMAVIELV